MVVVVWCCVVISCVWLCWLGVVVVVVWESFLVRGLVSWGVGCCCYVLCWYYCVSCIMLRVVGCMCMMMLLVVGRGLLFMVSGKGVGLVSCRVLKLFSVIWWWCRCRLVSSSGIMVRVLSWLKVLMCSNCSLLLFMCVLGVVGMLLL